MAMCLLMWCMQVAENKLEKLKVGLNWLGKRSFKFNEEFEEIW